LEGVLGAFLKRLTSPRVLECAWLEILRDSIDLVLTAFGRIGTTATGPLRIGPSSQLET
jgi:hypothetical protein